MDPRLISTNGGNLWDSTDVRVVSAAGYDLWATTSSEEPCRIVTIGVCDPIGYGIEIGIYDMHSSALLVKFSASYFKPTMVASEIEDD